MNHKQVNVNMKLREISLELHVLKDHLQLVEKQISHTKKIEKRRLDKIIGNLGLYIDKSEMKDAIYDYNYKIEFLLPRFLRAPFLVSLNAVYETAIKNVADMMQERQSQLISRDEYIVKNKLRGNLLKKMMKYFKQVLKFDLCVNETDWERVNMLSELRNAIAHANGRVCMLNEDVRNKILAWEKKKIGISIINGYIIIDAQLSDALFESVRSTLNNMIVRYKKWKNK